MSLCLRKGKTLVPSPYGTPELPTMVIRDARKRGPLGLMSTSLLLMHLGEWLAMRNRSVSWQSAGRLARSVGWAQECSAGVCGLASIGAGLVCPELAVSGEAGGISGLGTGVQSWRLRRGQRGGWSGEFRGGEWR